MNALLLLKAGWDFKQKTQAAAIFRDPFEQRKLKIFNRLNCLGLITGIILPVAGLFNNDALPPVAWLVACSPALISSTVLLLNYYNKITPALMVYFTFYPLLSSMVYAADLDLGIELFFILYGVLAVFFIPKLKHVIICSGLSAISYMVVFVLRKDYSLTLSELNYPFYVCNHLLALFFIFYALLLIKRENTGYQEELLQANHLLQSQKELLEQQSAQLNELNTIKNKLFSVIAHDLRTPIYALKNLFKNMQTYDLPAEEIKLMVPDISQELHFTTSLMENLLQWAKSQLQAAAAHPEALNLQLITQDIIGVVNLQAKTKSISILNKIDSGTVWADKEMTQMVLRNLVSNAVKFTPVDGLIQIGTRENQSHIEVYIKDNGEGMTLETIEKLQENAFYTTAGTANESGTGLGLMLCKEYLLRNNGWLTIHSEPGNGSEFSFTLPKLAK